MRFYRDPTPDEIGDTTKRWASGPLIVVDEPLYRRTEIDGGWAMWPPAPGDDEYIVNRPDNNEFIVVRFERVNGGDDAE